MTAYAAMHLVTVHGRDEILTSRYLGGKWGNSPKIIKGFEFYLGIKSYFNAN